MRKSIAWLLILALALGCCPAISLQAGAETEGYYEYTVTDGEATVTGCDRSISGEIIIPAALGGYPVVGIDSEAFLECTNLTSVIIPDSVQTVGLFAFSGCTGLTDVSIGKGMQTIGGYAFSYCDNLTNVSLGNSVQMIGEGAFEGCSSLATMIVPDSVQMIEDWAFCDCDSLIDVTIGSGVSAIGEYAFSGCSSLTRICVSENNTNYSSDDRGVLFNKAKTELIQAPGALSGGYIIPDGVQLIGYGAFEGCTGLTSVTIPDSIQSIDHAAFSNCSEMIFNFYDNGVYLGNAENPYVALLWGAFDDITACVIHPSTKVIANGAFYQYGNLQIVTIPDNVITIGIHAFSACDSLTSVTIGNNVQTIGAEAFSFCEKLTTVTLGNSIQTIGADAFYYCHTLTGNVYDNGKYLGNKEKPYLALIGGVSDIITDCNVHPDTKVIADRAFNECYELTGIWVPESNTNYSSDDRGVLFNKAKTKLIQAPCALSGEYVIADTVRTIGYQAFRDCIYVTAVTIPDGVETIGEWAFYNCGSLNTLTIPDSVCAIGILTFWGCRALTDVYYTGTEAQWTQMQIDGYGNESLENATIHYTSVIIGNLDGNETVDEDDAIYLLQYVLLPDLFPVTQPVDYDGNGMIDEDDAIYLLQHVLLPDLFPL